MPRVRYIQAREEATFGAGSVTGGTIIDLASADIDAPSDQVIIYPGAARRAKSKTAPAPYIPQGPISFAADEENVGYFLKWALGNVTSAQPNVGTAPTVWTHTFTPSDALKSFQLNVGKDLFEHQFLGCMIDTLQFQVEKEFFMVTPEIRAQKDAKGAIQSALVIPTNPLFAYHQVLTTVAGTDYTGKVESLDLSISNNLQTEEGVALGSRFAKRFEIGEFLATATVKIAFEGSAEYERFWGSATGPIEGVTTLALVFEAKAALIAATYFRSLKITLPKVVVTAVQAPVQGSGKIEQTLTFTALHDDTATYPLQVVLTNTKTNYTS
jgi:hypothetical protein